MRGVMVCLLAVSVVVAFSSTGCSHRSRKHKRESLQITTTSLPDATEGVAYSYTVTASGGNSANYNWSATGLPTGLDINPTTGEISGIPAANTAGTYTVDVTVDDGQQTASKQFDLTVNVQLVADFEATPTQGTAPLDVTFTDLSTGNPTSWEWDFDNDGVTDSTDQNPSWTYNSSGWYTVKLTVSDGTNSDTCVKEKYILVYSNVYYVNGVNGNDAKSGLDWGNAWKTIGHALLQAGDYDLVLVADATYNETNLDFGGKKIHLKGVDHNTAGQRPVIDCQSSGRAFYFHSGETKDSAVENFIIKNGSADSGGAIYCSSSSPSIVNCIFSDNSATQNHGGAFYCQSSNPSITGCTFKSNSAHLDGGAIYSYSSNPTLTNCAFIGNSATGSQYNYGGAIHCNRSDLSLTNCTFSGNDADYGGAIACYLSSLILNNSILWGNSAGDGDEIYISDSGSSCTLNYCCVDNTGYGGKTGNIDDSNNCIHSDPQFVDPANGDYHLKPTSPCIDKGDNTYISGVDKDLDGNQRVVDGGSGAARVDIGAYEKQ